MDSVIRVPSLNSKNQALNQVGFKQRYNPYLYLGNSPPLLPQHITNRRYPIYRYALSRVSVCECEFLRSFGFWNFGI